MNRYIIISFSIIFFNCSSPQNENQEINEEYSILFIGNSLTYFNNLPELVKQKSLEEGISISVEMRAFGNYGLEDHWNDGVIQNMINNNKYDYVVIQQGPSSQTYGRTSLIDYGGRIKEVCVENDSKLIFFMVWPSLTYYHTFNGVVENYTAAAVINNSILAPVGKVWREHFDGTGDYSYYGSDGFHPSLAGSKIAAEVIVQSLN